jgi:uncharacterized protein (DUF427 family)
MSEEKRHFFVTSNPANRVRVYYQELLLADTEKPLLLKEVGKTVYDQVYYIPLEDVNQDLLQDNPHRTHCPIKGEASYFDLSTSTETIEKYRLVLPISIGLEPKTEQLPRILWG